MQRRWKAEFCNNQFDKIGRSSEIKLHHWSPSSSISDKIIHFSDHKQRCKEDRKHKIGRSSEIKLHHWSSSSSISDKIIHFIVHKQRCKEDRKHKIGKSSEIKLPHWSLLPLHLIETLRVAWGTCKKNETFVHLFVSLRYKKMFIVHFCNFLHQSLTL